jgi:hypothetical protein
MYLSGFMTYNFNKRLRKTVRQNKSTIITIFSQHNYNMRKKEC